MRSDRLHPHAKVAFILAGLYNAAEALCQIFVSVYFWINSHDMLVLCRYYLALYAVTPIVFLLAGWYSKRRDRLHVYRLGVILHALYYGTLLYLRESSANYTLTLGILLGITWGAFWAGANTINYDVTTVGRREHFIGIMNAISYFARLLGPLLGGLIISIAPTKMDGYHLVFAAALLMYIASFFVTFYMPRDPKRMPFNIRRALFPGKDQRDWRYIMMASFTLAGTFEIPTFLMGILMYVETGSEFQVGGFAAFQAIIGVAISYICGRIVKPHTQRANLFWSSVLMAASGFAMMFPISITSLIIFAILRSISMAMFSIGHFSIRMDIIMKSAQDSLQRIEYLCAWEIPLAIGRTIMMILLLVLSQTLNDTGLGIRIVIILLCLLRPVTYWLLAQTSPLRKIA